MECWSAFKCVLFTSFELASICDRSCANEQCVDIIEATCPDMFFISSFPILFNDTYLAYEKNDAKWFLNGQFQHPFVCYNESHRDRHSPNRSKVVFSGTPCHRNAVALIWTGQSDLNEEYLRHTKDILKRYRGMVDYTSVDCTATHAYQCVNSTRCIDALYVNDGMNDCPFHDDENPLAHTSPTPTVENEYQCGRCYIDQEVPVGDRD